MLLLFRCFPAVLGFLSLDFLREEMFAHPEQPLPNYPECVSAPHAGGVMPQGENNSTASPLKLMYSSEATMDGAASQVKEKTKKEVLRGQILAAECSKLKVLIMKICVRLSF